jgi:hypothetical protein
VREEDGAVALEVLRYSGLAAVRASRLGEPLLALTEGLRPPVPAAQVEQVEGVGNYTTSIPRIFRRLNISRTPPEGGSRRQSPVEARRPAESAAFDYRVDVDRGRLLGLSSALTTLALPPRAIQPSLQIGSISL